MSKLRILIATGSAVLLFIIVINYMHHPEVFEFPPLSAGIKLLAANDLENKLADIPKGQLNKRLSPRY